MKLIPTIKYYDDNALTYYENTVRADMKALYAPFLKRIKSGASILDVGCGSGRDSLYFKNLGYKVTAIDGSAEMVRLCSELIGQSAQLMRFDDLRLTETYGGIWACASLLPVARNHLVSVLKDLTASLEDGGAFYMSFKHGDSEFRERGRYFNCMDEALLRKMLLDIPTLCLEEVQISEDVRPGHEGEYWLNAYLTKTEIVE